MSYDAPDPALLIGLQKLAERHGEGFATELGERLAEETERNAAGAEVVAIPGLHQRPVTRLPHGAYSGGKNGRGAANVIAFPLPRWKRNEKRRRS
ncbi:hypothetical protein [Ciceribacter thiooxidans]|uniref:Mutator family transposase n=1 Tax=Ciceribacter thiooxidans TaxID=1969821 RepID=A0ABV7I5S5_9HYPH|nr:hypothetical protein [Ciceribacter thiooxidans]